jgi:hypothetical protein
MKTVTVPDWVGFAIHVVLLAGALVSSCFLVCLMTPFMVAYWVSSAVAIAMKAILDGLATLVLLVMDWGE